MNKPDQFVDEDGKACFRCAVCGETFYSDPAFPEEKRLEEMTANTPAPDSEEPIHSVCEDCYQKMLPSFRRAAELIRQDAAVIPQATGQVKTFTCAEAMEFLGMAPDGKEVELNRYVQVVESAPPDVQGDVLDLQCAVARIRQIQEEYQARGEFRSDLMDRLATCDAPRLEKLAARLAARRMLERRDGE